MTSTTRAVLVAAAVISLALMFRAGHRNPSLILMVMFALWVSSPFAVLAFVGGLARRWPERSRSRLRVCVYLVALGTVIVYGIDAVRPLASKAAFIYLVVPLVSWIAVGAWTFVAVRPRA